MKGATLGRPPLGAPSAPGVLWLRRRQTACHSAGVFSEARRLPRGPQPHLVLSDVVVPHPAQFGCRRRWRLRGWLLSGGGRLVSSDCCSRRRTLEWLRVAVDLFSGSVGLEWLAGYRLPPHRWSLEMLTAIA